MSSDAAITYVADPDRMQLDVTHGYLTRSYWSPGIPRETVARAMAHSLVFGAFDRSAGDAQVGFARVVTDRTTFAYLCDVFVLESHRGRGVAGGLMRFLLAHPDLQGLRRFALMTRDAHGLYARFGFAHREDQGRAYMEIVRKNPYGTAAPQG